MNLAISRRNLAAACARGVLALVDNHQLVGIAECSADAASSTAAAQEAFPGYDGDSYLAMTATSFFPEA